MDYLILYYRDIILHLREKEKKKSASWINPEGMARL
jgi:hypothetical protein